MKPGPSFAAVVIVVVGTVFALDLWGISTKWETASRAWWSRGRIRRRFLSPWAPIGNVRTVGVIVIVVGVLLFVALFFDRG